MVEQSQKPSPNKRWTTKRWLMLVLLVVGFAAIGFITWPYLAFLTDREELRRLILGAGPWAPLVYMFLQFIQVVIAPVPGTVISLAGGYVFETFWSTVYATIGTTIGFLVVFILSKRYGRRVMRYFVSEESVAKYDEVATSKGAFAFIAIGFLFPFIPDPVLGYIAGTTPIPTRVLMVISIPMRIPGIIMTSLVGSQVGHGNYLTVGILLGLLAIVLVLALIFYRQLNDWADKLYRLAIKEQVKSEIKQELKSEDKANT